VVYRIAKELSNNEISGIVTAFLWSVLPATILPASAFLLTSFFVVTSLTCFLEIWKLTRNTKKRNGVLAVALLIALLIFNPILGILLALFWVFSSGFLQPLFLRIRFSKEEITAVVIVLANLLFPQVSLASSKLIQDVFTSPAGLIILFLTIAAYIFILGSSAKKGFPLGNLLGFSYLTFIVMELFPLGDDFIWENSYGVSFSLFIFSLLVPIGEMIAEIYKEKGQRILLGIAIFVLIFAIRNVNLSFSFSKDIFYGDPILSFSKIAEGLLLSLFFVFLFSLFLDSNFIKVKVVGLMVFLFPIAMLFPLASSNYLDASFVSGYRRAARISKVAVSQSEELPIFVCSKRLRNRLWFLSSFESFRSSPEFQDENPFKKIPTNIGNRDKGIAIIDNECDDISRETVTNWILLNRFDQGDSLIEVFRIK
jgi:hypothetical protein